MFIYSFYFNYKKTVYMRVNQIGIIIVIFRYKNLIFTLEYLLKNQNITYSFAVWILRSRPLY